MTGNVSIRIESHLLPIRIADTVSIDLGTLVLLLEVLVMTRHHQLLLAVGSADENMT